MAVRAMFFKGGLNHYGSKKMSIFSGSITSKAAGFHVCETMPAVGFVFTGIAAVVSGDADFGSAIQKSAQ
jgi:hypothetical protein